MTPGVTVHTADAVATGRVVADERPPAGSCRLSIIVPVYNMEPFVEKCLRSLLDQGLDHADYEIIVVDDGSDDRSMEIVRSLTRDGPIRIHSQPNAGLSAARNAGIRLARGRYLAFVDSDDFVAAGSYARLVPIAEQASLQVLGFGASWVPVGTAVHHVTELSGTPVIATRGVDFMAQTAYLNGVWWYLIERDLMASIDLWFEEGRLVEDALFTANLLSAADRVAYQPLDVYRYVQRPGSIMNAHDRQHSTRMVRDYEHVAEGLDALARKRALEGVGTPAFYARLQYRRETYVFFMVVRAIRGGVPVKTELRAAIDRLRAAGLHPLRMFPSNEHAGWHYRVATAVVNRPLLLYPVAWVSARCWSLAVWAGTRLRSA